MNWRAVVGAAVGLLLGAGFLAYAALVEPEIAFLTERGGAPWIGLSAPPGLDMVETDLAAPPRVRFERSFLAPQAPVEALLHVRALGGVRVEINGVEVLARGWDSGDWKRGDAVSVGASLRPGENRVGAEVSNPLGPPLLELWIDGPGLALRTGPEWTASRAGGPPTPAARADDTRGPRAESALPTLGAALSRLGPALALLFGVGVVAFALWSRAGGVVGTEALPTLALVGAAVLWCRLAARALRIPLLWGFDAQGHLEYLRYLQERGSLPLASDGWSMFHPPLPYALCAGLLAALRVPHGGALEQAVLRALPLAAGVVQIVVADRLGRRWFPRDPGLRSLAILFAAFVPMNLTLSSYFSNEPLHAAFAALALLAASSWLRRPDAPVGLAALTGGALALALLCKATALVGLAVTLSLFAARLCVDRAVPRGRAAASLAALAGIPLVLAGWWYARNALHFGAPVVGNWSRLAGQATTWWQAPGFHFAGYYLSFGVSLWSPFFAGFHSFWDGIYSTLWSDALLGGVARAADRHRQWDYAAMAGVPALSLPATVLVAAGALGFCARALRERERGVALDAAQVAGLLASLGFAILYMTLRVPSYAQAKAFYALALVVPLGLSFASGFGALDAWLAARGAAFSRALLRGWLAAWLGAIAIAFTA